VLAVGVGRPEMAAARRCSLFRSCKHRYLPSSTMQAKRSAASASEGYPKIPHDDEAGTG